MRSGGVKIHGYNQPDVQRRSQCSRGKNDSKKSAKFRPLSFYSVYKKKEASTVPDTYSSIGAQVGYVSPVQYSVSTYCLKL